MMLFPWLATLIVWRGVGVWLTVAGYLQLHHASWRDEVRAYTFALRGNDVPAMLRVLHVGRHLALWYLLLRWVHAVVGSPIALQIAGFAVNIGGIAFVALLALQVGMSVLLTADVVRGGVFSRSRDLAESCGGPHYVERW